MMSTHSRRISLLGEPHLTTVNLTASLAKRIPAPANVGSGHFKAPTVLRGFAVETHENRLIHSPLSPPQKFADGGKGVFCFSKMKLDSFAPKPMNQGL
jgi:hypothetical protein